MATVNRGAARETKTGDARILATGQDVIVQEAQALRSLAQDLDGNFAAAVKQIIRTRDRVVVAGIGKSGHIGRKAAATLASTGTPAFFLHAAEAAHGDLGMVGAQDTLLVISNSGLTREIRPLLSHGRRLGTPIIGIASTLASPLGRQADILLRLPRAPEACPARIAPTTSTTMMLALCDALALAVMRERGIERNDLARLHPGGDIGYRLSPIDELIDRDMPLPLVRAEAPLRDVVLEMTSVGKGIAGVVDAHGALIGVITDGDLRRSFDQVLIARAGEVMTRTPITVPSGTTIGDCHDLMTDSKITVVFVTDRQDERRPVGLVNIHDLAMLS